MKSAMASLLQSRRRIYYSGGDGGVWCEGDSAAIFLVYLVCFVPQPNEPKKLESLEKPAPRHTPRDGSRS